MHQSCSFVCVAAVIAGIAVARAQAADWSVSAGYVTRFGMDLDIRGSSRVQSEGIHAAATDLQMPGMRQSGPSYRYAPGASDTSGYANRSFDDGFVFIDPGTADPNAVVPGLTWYWGYDNASQYDPSAGTLSFHRNLTGTDVQTMRDVSYGEQVTRNTLRDDPLALDDRMSGQGIGISADCGLYSKGMFDIRICGGVNALWGAGSHMESSTYQEQIRVDRIRVEDNFTYTDTHSYQDTYTYDATGVVPPAPPYAGTYGGPGPVIPNVPSSDQRGVLGSQRQTQSTRQTSIDGSSFWTAANRVSFDVDSALYDLWIGPRLAISPCQRLSVFAIPSVSFNYVNVDVKRMETFTATFADGSTSTLQSWRDYRSEGDWLFGAGLAIGVDIQIVDRWFASVHGGYDWVARDVTVTVEPNKVCVNPSGYTFGGGVGRRF